jgi:hypothetical protein
MASQMKYNLKDARDLDAAFRLTWSGGWTYSATGATPNGTNAYADTKLATNILGLDSAHLSLYSRTNSNGTIIDIGSSNSASAGYDFQLVSRFSNINYSILNSKSPTGFAQTTSLGFALVSRVLSTGYAYFLNNSKTSVTKASDTRNSFNIYIAARNTANVAEYFSNRETAFASIGDGLNDQDAQLLNQIVEKYQVALSRGVQAAQSFYYNSAYSNEANTYLYSTQITGTTQVSAINTLINGLKANNLWTKMKAVYPFVTDYRNILAYTEDFANAYWLKYRVNVSGNTTTAPNGTLTADSLSDTAVNDAHQLYLSLLATAPNTYTFSFYVKANNSTKNLAIYPFTLSAAGGTGSGGVILTQTGTFVANIGSGVSSYSSTNVGDGWYRISVTGYTTNTNEVRPVIGFANGTNETYLGDGSGIYIWGAQFEIGSTATAYQPVLAANSSSSFMSAQMKFNLVNPQDTDAAFRLAFSGGWTYSTNGAQPNGTNGYADTKLVPSANYANYNSHLSLYSRTDANGGFDMGSETNTFELLIRYSGTFYSRFSGDATYSNPNSLGYYIANTISGIIKGFKNGANVSNTTNANQVVNSYNVYIGAVNSLGSASLYSNRQYSFATIGTGLTDAEAALLYSLVQQYQTDLSRQV